MESKNIASNKHEGDNAVLRIQYEESKYTCENCIRFIECLPVPSGSLASLDPKKPNLIKLMPWQKQLINGIFPKYKPMRNEILLSISRRNGKSVTMAAFMTFMLFNKHSNSRALPGSLFVSAANNKEQAAIIYRVIKTFCSTVVDLWQDCKISDYHKTIEVISSPGTMYKAIPADPDSALGGCYAGAICDEVSYWSSNEVVAAIRSGMGSTPRSRRFMIQTSTVPLTAEHFFNDELKFFAKRQSTPTHYALVKITDPKRHNPKHERTWKMSNPSYGVLIHKESFTSELETTKVSPQHFPKFCTYRCNMPVAPLLLSSNRFLQRDKWEALKDENSSLERGEQIVVSYDAAGGNSLSVCLAMSVSAPHRIECLIVVPKKVERTQTGTPFRIWADKGWCQLSQQDHVPKNHIVDKYLYYQNNYDVVAGMSDLFGWAEIKTLADEVGLDLSKHKAKNTHWTDANDGLDALSRLIHDKQIIHDGNLALTYCLDNIRTKTDTHGAIVIDRKTSTAGGRQIDAGICMMFCSLLLASAAVDDDTINYEDILL